MLNEIISAIIQAATEFLPVSSSGHLALVSNLIDKPDLFFFTTLHLASMIAVLIFTRKEIFGLLSFNREYKRWWIYLIIGTIPAALFGYFFNDFIEGAFSSFLYLGIAFLFTGFILFLTKFSYAASKLNIKNSFVIGLFQVLALFPGVSRSGMTISSGLLMGVDKERAVKFSFLLFIPLAFGAFILESGKFSFSFSLVISFFVSLILSLIFLSLLLYVIKKEKFWWFSIYCFIIGLLSFVLYFLM